MPIEISITLFSKQAFCPNLCGGVEDVKCEVETRNKEIMMDWTLIRGTNSEPDPSSDVLRQDWQIKAVLASFWPQLLVGAELKAGVLL